MRWRSHSAATALGALATLNAYRPLTRRGYAVVPAFAAGLFDTELPLLAAGLQLAVTASALKRGAARSNLGRLGLAINAASIAGLVNLHREARRSGTVLEQALADALGPDYRARMAWPPACRDDSAPVVRSHVPLPLVRAKRRYVASAARNLPYGDAGMRNHLDVWRRSDLPRDARAPVLLTVHGGAWVTGNKEIQALPLLSHLAERGWLCIAINYRLGGKAAWPDLVADVKRSIVWTKANIASFGGDPDFLAITGGSAGGHLSALAALSANDPAFQPGFEDADTTVQAAVPLYGVYDWTGQSGGHAYQIPFLERHVVKQPFGAAREVFEQASPITRVRRDAPPFFVLHGSNDTLAYVEPARAFVAALRSVSEQPVAFAELPFAQHAFEFFRSVRALHAVHAIERFLAFVYGEHRSRAGRSPHEAGLLQGARHELAHDP